MLYVNVTATCFLQTEIHIRSDCRDLTLDQSITQTQILMDRELGHAYRTGLDRAGTLMVVRDFFEEAAGASCSRSYGGEALEGWRLTLDAMDDEAIERRMAIVVPPDMEGSS